MVKSLPAMQETQVQSLGGEGPLEKEMAIHSSILAWKIPWMEKPGRLQSMGSKRVLYDLTQGSNLHLQKKTQKPCISFIDRGFFTSEAPGEHLYKVQKQEKKTSEIKLK